MEDNKLVGMISLANKEEENITGIIVFRFF